MYCKYSGHLLAVSRGGDSGGLESLLLSISAGNKDTLRGICFESFSPLCEEKTFFPRHLNNLPQSYCMSLRSGNCVLMLHWIRWRLRVRGATWAESMEEKTVCLWLREGGGWQQCMEIRGASTGGITNVNLKLNTEKQQLNHKSFSLSPQ